MPGPFVEPAVPPPTPPVLQGAPISPQPAAPQGSNTVVKVILIVVAVIMFMMLLAAGSCFYVAYRVKKKAHEFSQEMGANATPYTGKRDPCLLSSNEVGFILREPTEAGESRGDMACEYRYGRGGNRRLDVEFTWHWISSNQVGAALYDSGVQYWSKVGFRSYDDGWRVVEEAIPSNQPLDQSLRNAQPVEP